LGLLWSFVQLVANDEFHVVVLAPGLSDVHADVAVLVDMETEPPAISGP